ncbi:MAG: SGNH/GDSL hydrolase family protein [Myxococcales bacterium]|nr:SGNH/GDSL hydrolase family protein [Myxococcales bacterium]
MARLVVACVCYLAVGCGSDDTGAPRPDAGSGGVAGQGGVAGGGGGVASAGVAGQGGAAGGAGALQSGPARYLATDVRSPITEAVASRLKAIASADASRAGDVFMKVGASGTVNASFLYCFAGSAQPQYQLAWAGNDALQPAVTHFRAGSAAGSTPFDRATLAAKVGMSANWAIGGSPSPLEQELSALNPRYAFVNYGTNDMQLGVTHASALWPFVENLSKLLDQLEAAGVVPIVSGLNPRTDSAGAALWVPTYDAVTRGLAEQRQLPYLSLYLSAKDLPNQGLISDGIHGNAYVTGGSAQPCVFDAPAMQFNYNRRNLASVQILDAAWRIVAQGAPAPDAPPPGHSGTGTATSPFVVDALPFTHAADSSAGEALIASHPGCNATQDESGPELRYRLTLNEATPLRLMVFDRAGVDVDIHLLSAGGGGDGCLERHDRLIQGTFGPGSFDVVVDSFASAGVAQSGAYLFVALRCEAGDPDCA